jgi:hypothetical protein
VFDAGRQREIVDPVTLRPCQGRFGCTVLLSTGTNLLDYGMRNQDGGCSPFEQIELANPGKQDQR